MPTPTIRRVLVANRGEVALRVLRTCQALGLETVAVYSDADADAPHVRAADRAFHLGAAPAAESYLSVPRLLTAARETAADAIHPGYGFLSESALFATACQEAEVVFVGPSPEVITLTGSKIACRELAEGAGVPVIPGGVPADQTTDGLRAATDRIGYPALLKPSAGGGGKGMKVVRGAAEAAELIAASRREAEAAFGDGTLYVERHLAHPRHVEVQVVGDRHGRMIHLFERECSIQRRYQKVVEETPAPELHPVVRHRILDAALAVSRAAGYDNVGTVEFLVEGDGEDASFFFLEMNTRLQVEHPITELCTGVDLVQLQLDVSAGIPLPWTQEDVVPRGHAVECRIYAEDAASDHLPQAGRVAEYLEPTGPGIRVDSGIERGTEVTVHYDPLLAKLATHGPTRESARRRAVDALRRFAILGLRTNVAYLRGVLEHPRFVAGGTTTGFLAEEHDALLDRIRDPSVDPTNLLAALAAVATSRHASGARPRPEGATSDPWLTLEDWR